MNKHKGTTQRSQRGHIFPHFSVNFCLRVFCHASHCNIYSRRGPLAKEKGVSLELMCSMMRIYHTTNHRPESCISYFSNSNPSLKDIAITCIFIWTLQHKGQNSKFSIVCYNLWSVFPAEKTIKEMFICKDVAPKSTWYTWRRKK